MSDEPYRTTGIHTTEDKSRTKLQQEGWPKLKGSVLLRPKSQSKPPEYTGGGAPESPAPPVQKRKPALPNPSTKPYIQPKPATVTDSKFDSDCSACPKVRETPREKLARKMDELEARDGPVGTTTVHGSVSNAASSSHGSVSNAAASSSHGSGSNAASSSHGQTAPDATADYKLGELLARWIRLGC